VESSSSAKQLTSAESWLKKHSTNPVLLFTLGRLCLRNKLWGKARSYLEASISIDPSAYAYRELGALLETMGEPDKALTCFKAGLELTSEIPLQELPASLKPSGPQLESPEQKGTASPKLEVVAEAK
jgi:HemY protein